LIIGVHLGFACLPVGREFGIWNLNMKVLGIDTSTRCGSIGLIDEERVISEYLLNTPMTHSERLIEAINYLLKEAHCLMEDLDGWAISLGPGSFTGLRIGVSTIKGLAYATQKPVAGIASLDALASQISPTPYLICPVLDARKGEVYTSFYRYDEAHLLLRRSDYLAIKPEDLMKNIKEKVIFVGDGIKTYGSYFRDSLPSFALFPSPSLHLPHGSTVARLGVELLHKGELLDLKTFIPIYVRPSEAEIKWQEKRPI
jgi:tRNA threonylcarbamoyladenosine biosynthesis protein TsaB